MCALETLAEVMKYLPYTSIATRVLPTFLLACGDKVPNVQFCAARHIKARKHLIEPTDFDTILVPKLREMTQAEDLDVAYYALKALE